MTRCMINRQTKLGPIGGNNPRITEFGSFRLFRYVDSEDTLLFSISLEKTGNDHEYNFLYYFKTHVVHTMEKRLDFGIYFGDTVDKDESENREVYEEDVLFIATVMQAYLFGFNNSKKQIKEQLDGALFNRLYY